MRGLKTTQTTKSSVVVAAVVFTAAVAAALLSALSLNVRASMAHLARLALARKLDAVETLPRRPSPTFTTLRRTRVRAAQPEKGGRIPPRLPHHAATPLPPPMR